MSITPDYRKVVKSSLTKTQKVAIPGTFNLNNSGVSIPHNMGKIPYIRIWPRYKPGEISGLIVISSSLIFHDRWLSAPDLDISVDTNFLYLTNTINGPITGDYRIYYDA